MTRSKLLSAALKLACIGCLLGSSVLAIPEQAAAASCSQADKRKMQKEGLTPRAIERICGPDNEDDDDEPRKQRRTSPQAQQRMSSRCYTPVVACFMGGSGPVGTPCWCATPYGPATGSVQ